MTNFSIEVSYAQLSVFDSTLAAPFNDWTDEHVAQGFAWRPGSVSFSTLDSAGLLLVDVCSHFFEESRSSAERIIAVPFKVPEHGGVEVSSISGGIVVELSPGEYELVFEHGRRSGHGMWANLYFRSVQMPVPSHIIRADAALSPPAVLVMTAEPAGRA